MFPIFRLRARTAHNRTRWGSSDRKELCMKTSPGQPSITYAPILNLAQTHYHANYNK